MAQDLQVWESGSYHHRKGLWVYEGGWKPAKGGWVWEAGAWQRFYTPIVITPDSTSFTSATNVCSANGNSPSGPSHVYCAVSGGTAPYIATLIKLSGGSELSITESPATWPNGPNVTNTAAVLENGVFRLTITDANGSSNFVDLTLACQHL